ncbi:MAG: helix-turn-helix domain-containing protein [Planctomycetota bacterium]
MRRSECPIAAALDILGDRWTLLVLRDVLLSHQYASSEIAKAEGIATNIRNDRLERLQEAGLLERHVDPSDGRRRNYLPTERAMALVPVLVDLIDWGEANTGADVPPEVMKVVRGVRANREMVIEEIITGVRKSVATHKS